MPNCFRLCSAALFCLTLPCVLLKNVVCDAAENLMDHCPGVQTTVRVEGARFDKRGQAARAAAPVRGMRPAHPAPLRRSSPGSHEDARRAAAPAARLAGRPHNAQTQRRPRRRLRLGPGGQAPEEAEGAGGVQVRGGALPLPGRGQAHAGVRLLREAAGGAGPGKHARVKSTGMARTPASNQWANQNHAYGKTHTCRAL